MTTPPRPTPSHDLNIYRPSGAEIIEVIRVDFLRGDGVTNVMRPVIRYYSKDGTFLAEHDPCPEPEVSG